MSQDTEQFQPSPRDPERSAWKLVEQLKQELQVARESLAAKDREIAAQREKLADFIITHSFATGHGDTFDDLLGKLGSEISAQAKRIAALQEENARLKADTWCDVCCGTGDPKTGNPCICGGTGRAQDAERELRVLLYALEKQRDALAEALKVAEAYISGDRKAIDNIDGIEVLKRIYAALASVDEQKQQETPKP